MAKLVKIGSKWYSDFTHNGKRIKHALSKNYGEAQLKLLRLIESYRGVAPIEDKRDTSWELFKARYIEYSTGTKRPLTVIRDRAAISSLDKSARIKLVEQITPEVLERWKSTRLGNGIGAPTVARDLKAVKALLRKAVSWGYAKQLDWSSVKPPKTARGKLLWYTPKELAKLLSHCHGCYLTLALLASRSGLRRGECRGLRWEDVDFGRNQIHVCPHEDFIPKDYEQRFIPMDKTLRDHLAGHKDRSGYVLKDTSGNRPSLAVLSAYFAKVSKRAGLKGRIHTLRHTFGSHLAQAGVSLYAIAKMMGHDSVAVTQIYSHLSPKTYESAISSLPKLK